MQKINTLFIKTIFILSSCLLSYQTVLAGEMAGWNPDNVVTDSGPYTPEVTYASHLFDDMLLTNETGAVIWVESDVMAPGLDVVVDDDVDGSNCVMTAGFNPLDMSVKQCSDPFQTSKRFKLSATQVGAAMDLVFDVNQAAASPEPHRILAKLLNSTDQTISDIIIEVGFGLGADFVPAAGGLGLDFSDRDGMIWSTDVATGETGSINLDALLPFGLYGDASTDPNHDVDGYFDATARARFGLLANRGTIVSTGLSDNYANEFGDLLAKSQVIDGYFWDDDDDDETDPLLIAHQTSEGWFTLRPDQWWIDYMLPIPDTNPDGTLADTTLNDWAANPNDYNIDAIEDLANVNLNVHVTLADISGWPGYDSQTQTAQFTLRVSTRSVIFRNGFE